MSRNRHRRKGNRHAPPAHLPDSAKQVLSGYKEENFPFLSVLPERHRKNYDEWGRFIIGPRPCELEAQRRSFLSSSSAQ